MQEQKNIMLGQQLSKIQFFSYYSWLQLVYLLHISGYNKKHLKLLNFGVIILVVYGGNYE